MSPRRTSTRPAFALAASVALALVALLIPAAARAQDAPRVGLRLQGEAYAGAPFQLLLVAEGFDEDPAPAQPAITIPGATVTAQGAQPNVSQSVQIVNGRRYDQREVTWVFRYRVEAPAGTYQVPAIAVVQGGKRASSQPARLPVRELPTTDAMRIALDIPARPVSVGESLEVHLDWLLAKDVNDQQLGVPLLSMDDKIGITIPPVADRRSALPFSTAGGRDLQIPFVRDRITVGGREYTRFRFTILIQPRQPGHIEIPPATVVAGVATGPEDFFGRASTRLFRASDVAHSLEVKPLPLAGRPDSFAGAVGTSFSITTRTSRSVVQLGEPVDLDITIKSDARLDGLSLGKLDGDGGLPAKTFTAPPDPPVGELSDNATTKTFRVPVQVIAPATEIPALAFSYFDPVKGQYQTIHSEPIALSVKGGSVVGASDVVGAAPSKKAAPAASAAPAGELSLVGADLALSAPGDALDRPLSGALLWALVLALYLIPIALFAARTWQVRTATSREEAGEVKAARKHLEAELARAATAPAKDAATALPSALRQLARALGRPVDDAGLKALIARVETEGFAPGSAPLAEPLRREVEALAGRWLDQARNPTRAGAGAAAIALLALVVPGAARADAPGTATAAPGAVAPTASFDALIQAGRGAYQDALAQTDAATRRVNFARAAAAFAQLAAEHPDSPGVLTDWGNAALGAGDLGAATLAFRRALDAHGGDPRARRNLAWLRARQPDSLRPAAGGAAQALFFFHDWTRARRLVVGAAAFALAILLAAPWSPRRRLWRGLAVAPAIVWLAMTLSVLVEDDHGADAVVLESAILRAADSPGAPPALSSPVPPGAEVAILERRTGWSRVALASGTTGWLPDGALERVTPSR